MKVGTKSLGQRVAARIQKWVGSSTPGSSMAGGGGWLSLLGFDGPGGWFQQDVKPDASGSLLEFSAVYSCITLLAKDISKLPLRLVSRNKDGIWEEVQSPAFSPVLRKPNKYQTRIQFLSAWIVSKLVHGNTYIFKERDARGVVRELHVLDPRLVTVLVAPNGDVYYRLNGDDLAQVEDNVTVPATEIIHDRAECLYHPLIGVAPLVAAAMSATHGRRIQKNSVKFFENMSRPSGMLTAPATIDQDTADRLKTEFEAKFSGNNIGRLFVAGDGLKYEAMNIPAAQAQLIEQLKWTGEDVARCFHVPAYKIGLGEPPTFNNISTLQQDYYNTALHTHIECIEILLDEGLGLTGGVQSLGVELDVDVLLRLDPESLSKTVESGVKSGVMKPNEARRRMNLSPVEGGDEVYMQQQMWPLRTLVRPGTTSPEDGGSSPSTPEPTPPSTPTPEDQAAKLIAAISAGSRETSERIERALSDALAGDRLRAAQEAVLSAKAEAASHADVARKASADLSEARQIAEAMTARAESLDAQAKALKADSEAARDRAEREAAAAASVRAELDAAGSLVSKTLAEAQEAEARLRAEADEAKRSADAESAAVAELRAVAASAEAKAAQARADAVAMEVHLRAMIAAGSDEVDSLRVSLAELQQAAKQAEEVACTALYNAVELQKQFEVRANEALAAAKVAEQKAVDAQAQADSFKALSAERTADVERLLIEVNKSKADAERAALAEADAGRLADELTRRSADLADAERRAQELAERKTQAEREAEEARKAIDDIREAHEKALSELIEKAEADRIARDAAAAAKALADEAADKARLEADALRDAHEEAMRGLADKTEAADLVRAELLAAKSAVVDEARAKADAERAKSDADAHLEAAKADARAAAEKAEVERAAREAAEKAEEVARAEANAAAAQIRDLQIKLAEAQKPEEPKKDAMAEFAQSLIAKFRAATENRS